jgi:hypothetical protein
LLIAPVLAWHFALASSVEDAHMRSGIVAIIGAARLGAPTETVLVAWLRLLQPDAITQSANSRQRDVVSSRVMFEPSRRSACGSGSEEAAHAPPP